MNPIDRSQAPLTTPFGALYLPLPQIELLPNDIELYIIDKGDQEVCRIDILFEGGRYAATTPAIADLTGPMLRKGIDGMDADAIAEHLDYYGAWMQTATTLHYSTISLFSLNRNIDKVLPIVVAMINAPTLPTRDFDTLKEQRKQQLLINREKVRILAGETFNSLIFGKSHPYARITTPEDLETTTIDQIEAYHKNYYLNSHIRILLSGHIDLSTKNTIIQHLAKLPTSKHFNPINIIPIQPEEIHTSIIDKPGSMQSGIRMGMPTIANNHPDFPLLDMLNLILGGYFGSRLMTNIREEKGYTYGISSHIISLRNSAYFTIMTDAGTEYTLPLIDETKKEMQRLCDELITSDELETARNYLQGKRARVLDSPFAMSDYFVSSLIAGTPLDYFNHEDAIIRNATASDLRRIAQSYLRPEMLYTAIAGDKSGIEAQQHNI